MTVSFKAPADWLTERIHIELIGCGGTGSFMLDELFRMHTLLVRLDHPGLSVCAWDGDTVSEPNVGRQRFWGCDVGWPKAEILISRYNSFGDTEWQFRNEMLEKQACEKLRADVIITCVDNAKTRVMVGEAGRARHSGDTLWIDTGNDTSTGQVILGNWMPKNRAGDLNSPRMPNVLDLYPSLSEEEPERQASCSTEASINRQDFGINQRIAGEASGLLWRLIRHGEIDRHGSYVYLETGEVLPLPIDPEVWESF